MTTQAKLEDAVTGQQPSGGSDSEPPLVELYELFEAPKATEAGPNVIGLKSRPERYCQVFKARQWAKIGEEQLLVRDDLKGECAKPKGAYVQLQVVSGGEFSFTKRDSEIEPALVAVRKIRDHPHSNNVRDEETLSKSVA